MGYIYQSLHGAWSSSVEQKRPAPVYVYVDLTLYVKFVAAASPHLLLELECQSGSAQIKHAHDTDTFCPAFSHPQSDPAPAKCPRPGTACRSGRQHVSWSKCRTIDCMRLLTPPRRSSPRPRARAVPAGARARAAPASSHSPSSGTRLRVRSHRPISISSAGNEQREKRDEMRGGDALQKRDTMPIVTKRRCVGTTAKLTICVGMNTPLRITNQPAVSTRTPLLSTRIETTETHQLRMSVGTYACPGRAHIVRRPGLSVMEEDDRPRRCAPWRRRRSCPRAASCSRRTSRPRLPVRIV